MLEVNLTKSHLDYLQALELKLKQKDQQYQDLQAAYHKLEAEMEDHRKNIKKLLSKY